jgi:hypothetical protein
MHLFGMPVHVAAVDDLLKMKSGTGQPKDKQHAMQLQALKKILNEGIPE